MAAQWKLALASGDVWLLKRDSLLPYEASGDELIRHLGSLRVRAVKEVRNEDIKTGTARRDPPAPAGTEGRLLSALQNFYGIYLRVHFDGAERAIYVKPEHLEVIPAT